MKSLIFLIFCFAGFGILYAQSNPAITKTAIGKSYNKIDEILVFKNYKEWEGLLITESKKPKKIFSKISDGKNTMVLFSEYETRGYKILGILDLGKIEKYNRIILSDCRLNSKTDGFIIALVKDQNKAYFTNVIKAWKVDQNTNRFIEIPIKGIDCFNDEFENQE